MEIPVTLGRPGEARRMIEDESALGFGVYISNHMFLMDYRTGSGWHNPRIKPLAYFQIHPAAMVLHYGQEVFDGHKAYCGPEGQVLLFRARDNLARMSRSAERLCIPAYPEDVVLEGMKELLRIDREWVPSAPGTSLYVRPTIIATEPYLGVRPADQYLLYIITGPVGAYYPEGFAPVKILVEENYVRAAPGGIGAAKTAANYAASLKAQVEAHKTGYTQVLWLDAVERKYVEEVGTMNIAFKIKGELVTPPLGGTILPGITRDSVLTLCRDMGLAIQERPVTIEEVVQAARSGELEECFGIGTAAVISPVSVLGYQGQDVIIGDGQAGPLSQDLFTRLTDIQFGRAPDPHGWREEVI